MVGSPFENIAQYFVFVFKEHLVYGKGTLFHFFAIVVTQQHVNPHTIALLNDEPNLGGNNI